MFFHTTAFGYKYRGLTCLALMWFVTTPPERSAIMKVVYKHLNSVVLYTKKGLDVNAGILALITDICDDPTQNKP